VYKTLKCCDNAHAPVRRPESNSWGSSAAAMSGLAGELQEQYRRAKGWIQGCQ
jgi:hypothetical protein